MSITPERAAYARKRIERLNKKIEKLGRLNATLVIGADTPGSMNHSIIIANDKQIASSKQAIKRWQAEIAGVKS